MNICYPKKLFCYPTHHSNIIKLSFFFVKGTKTGNLKKHLQRRHIHIYEVLVAEESKASKSFTKEDIHIYKVVISLCLLGCPIITQETLDQFASKF